MAGWFHIQRQIRKSNEKYGSSSTPNSEGEDTFNEIVIISIILMILIAGLSLFI